MTRIITAVVLGGLVVYLIALAPLVLGVLAVFAVALAAAHETASLLREAECPVARTPVLGAVTLMTLGTWADGVGGLSAGLAAGLALTFIWIIVGGKTKGAVIRLSGGIMILLYPVWSLDHFILYLSSESGRRALLFLLLSIWVCDSAAYYVGSTLGRRKLAPQISPNKTVAGAVGGTLGAVGASLLLSQANLVPWSPAFTAGAGLVLAFLAQAGDLAESMIKRDAGVKDSGKLIPGHGGVMDRIDALLFALPVFYYLLVLSGGLS